MAEKSTKVVATATGFYDGSRVRPGTEFFVAAGEKASWFVPVNSVEAKIAAKELAAKKGAQTNGKQTTLSQVGKSENKTFTEVMSKDKKADDKKADDLT